MTPKRPTPLLLATLRTSAAAAVAWPLVAPLSALAQTGGGFDLTWHTIDGGGGSSAGGGFSLTGTIGQPDAGAMAGGAFTLGGGFWYSAPGATCYPNCDGSTMPPAVNVGDFTCFLQQYSAGLLLPPAQQLTAYANCDGSTLPPVINVGDFTCFLQKYAAGCP